jgi:hypothetical protein
MLKPSDILPGLVLRVISSHGLGAPVGSLATVKTIETSRSGDWLCVVEYHDKRAPKHGTRLYRSHLWERDLGRFEIVTEDTTSGRVKERRKGPTAGQSQTRIQLALPFPPVSGDNYISSAFTTSS